MNAKLDTLKPLHRGIITLLRKMKKLTAKEIHHSLDSDISEQSLRVELLELQDLGLIEIVGGWPNTYWRLTLHQNEL